MDYKNGKIYCIRSHKSNDVYIGSTTQPLHKRFYHHKNNYKYWKNGKYHYVTSFKLIDNYDD
jgi:predicted GIY-YIG superfamily endonuclease